MAQKSTSNMQARRSGPLDIAELNCQGCEGLSTLLDSQCRACILEQLGTQSAVDQVVLKRAYRRVYCSQELSKLARAFAALKQIAFDRTSYAASEDGKCKGCVSERHRELTELWPRLLENPHDVRPLNELARKLDKHKGECAECSKKYFLRIIASIKAGLSSSAPISSLSSKNYDEVFDARVMPFFVEGVYHPPRHRKLLETYELPGERGVVRIYKQLNRPLPFYELDLPELKLPPEQLELLHDAYEFEVREAPGHARFAYPTRILSFSEEWYNTRKAACYIPPLAWS